MPRSVLLTTLVLVAVAAGIGFWAGLRWQPLDETQVISRVAAHYVAETGGEVTDCLARPGQGDVWLRIICGAQEYRVNRRGKLLPPQGPST